jgi:hypothetical protein
VTTESLMPRRGEIDLADDIVVDADELDEDSFQPRMPLIVKGTLKRARRKWTDRWLLQRFGDDTCQVSFDSRTGREEFKQQVRLAEFLEDMDQSAEEEPDDGGVAYLFHSMPGAESAADLLDDIDLPPVIADLGEPSLHRFFAGPEGSGTLPHRHTYAINALTRGRKRWAIYVGVNPGVTRALVAESMQEYGDGAQAGDWFATQLEQIRARPRVRLWEFTQAAGDLVYIPAGFIHAVINLEPVVGFTVEFQPAAAEQPRPGPGGPDQRFASGGPRPPWATAGPGGGPPMAGRRRPGRPGGRRPAPS